MTAGAERVLMPAPWPGNVRELRNVIERAVHARGRGPHHRAGRAGRVEDWPSVHRRGPHGRPPNPPGESDRLDLVERDHILSILERTRGNKSEAARALGVSRRAFYRKLDRHGLSTPRADAAKTPDAGGPEES